MTNCYRSRLVKKETRQIRGAQLYDSIIVKKKRTESSEHDKDKTDTERDDKPSLKMPGEMVGGTMSKAMSYDVNPIYSL